MYQYNEFDHHVHDFNRFRYFYHLIHPTRYLRFNEWWDIHQFLTKPRPKKVKVDATYIRLIRDLFDDVHEPLCGPLASVDTIHRIEWAYTIGLITDEEQDAAKQFWRSTAR